MILSIMSVFDAKSESFAPPLFVRHPAQAVRWFQDCIGNPEHDYSKFSEDFTLFELGTFDDDSGAFTSFSAPQSVVRASVLKQDMAKVSPIREVR